MDLTQEKIDQLIIQVGGELSVEIVRYLLENGENISEFLIAEKLEVPINTIRKTLYILQENNLVTSMRKKDKKKGWYIYYWTFDNIQAKTLMIRMKEERMKNLKRRLDIEQNSKYFTCKRKCMRLTFERALENNFACPECATILQEVDNSAKVKLMLEELEFLEGQEKSEMLTEGKVEVEAAA
jgi:transcription initiation factor TFIIE subunit alpha